MAELLNDPGKVREHMINELGFEDNETLTKMIDALASSGLLKTFDGPIVTSKKLKSEEPDIELEKERIEKLEKERIEKLEKERIEKEKLEKEKLENERLEKEKLEHERLEKEKLEKERLEKEKLEKEKLEKEKLEKERIEKEILEKERIEKENLERERLKEKKKRTLERLDVLIKELKTRREDLVNRKTDLEGQINLINTEIVDVDLFLEKNNGKVKKLEGINYDDLKYEDLIDKKKVKIEKKNNDSEPKKNDSERNKKKNPDPKKRNTSSSKQSEIVVTGLNSSHQWVKAPTKNIEQYGYGEYVKANLISVNIVGDSRKDNCRSIAFCLRNGVPLQTILNLFTRRSHYEDLKKYLEENFKE